MVERFSSTAKAHVRKGSLLDGARLRKLLESANVGDVARQLMETGYAEYLREDIDTLHRDRLEFLLMASESNETESFFSCVGLERARFLRIWLAEQDIMLIKNKIWEIYSGRDYGGYFMKDIARDLDRFNFSLVDKHKLIAAQGLPEVLASIKNQKLATYIEEAVKRYGGMSKSVVVGAALDYFHIEGVFSAAKCFSGQERNGIMSIAGTLADILNITWIYRAKRYFAMSDEFIVAEILPARYRVQFETLKQLASLPPERMHERLAGTRYADLLPKSAETNSLDAAKIERNIRSLKRQNAVRVFQSGGVGLHLVLAYLVLKEIEIRDINVIIEVVRYDYDRKAAEGLLAYPLAS